MKRIVINVFTALLVTTLALALLHFINWSLFFIIIGSVLGFIIACLTVYNYKKIIYQFKVSQFKKQQLNKK